MINDPHRSIGARARGGWARGGGAVASLKNKKVRVFVQKIDEFAQREIT